MTKEEVFSFPSADGRTTVHAVRWTPEDGKYRAVLQITHGMVEYIERYRAFAEFLNDNGFLVAGHDHIGHGESVVSKDEWGFFAEHPSDTVVADMHTLREITRKEHPGVPYFMLGHSMGSYMLRKYLAIHGEGLTGAIIMGTGCIPDNTTKLAMLIAKLQAAFFGWHHISKLLQQLSYDKYYHQFDLTGKDASNSWLTKDEEIVKTYYADPKCTFVFTVNAYMGLFEAVLFDNQQENIEAVPKSLPLFFVSGAMDPVGGCGSGVKKVYNKFDAAAKEDITWKLYDNDRHEILNETDRDVVYHDILAWMNVHLA